MKRIIKYFVGRVYKPFLERYLSKTRRYSYKDIKLIIPQEVFHPGFFFSTKFLLRYLLEESLQGKTFLELGAGNGLISLSAARQGAIVTATDINPVAIEFLEKNMQRNHLRLNIILSDLFESVPDAAYDIIAINPPYFKKDPEKLIQYAWYCGKNGEYFDRLFRRMGKFIHRDSRVILVLSEVCDLEMIRHFAELYGWKLKPIKSRKYIYETFFIYDASLSDLRK